MPQVVRSARRSNQFFGINRTSRLHSAISFNYIGGKMMIARSLLSGCDLTFTEPSLKVEPPKGERIVSLMSLVPAQMAGIVDEPEVFSNVRKFLIGGSAIDDRLWTRIVSSGLDSWESYGMTETASHVALRRIVGPATCRPRFVPLNGIKLSVDEDRRLIITDGEVCIKTNDVVNLNKDGSFNIVGRYDDVIISGGIKIMPTEVEEIIRPYMLENYSEFFISSLPDEIWTSKIVLVCVASSYNGMSQEEIKSGIRHCIDSIPLSILPKKLRPKDIIIVPELPLTPSGKLMRRLV